VSRIKEGNFDRNKKESPEKIAPRKRKGYMSSGESPREIRKKRSKSPGLKSQGKDTARGSQAEKKAALAGPMFLLDKRHVPQQKEFHIRKEHNPKYR